MLTRTQWVGLPLLAAAPVLGLAGVLGAGRIAVVGRTAIVYAFLLFGLRVLGKRDLSQMTPFDAVLLFLIPQLFRNYLIASDNTFLTALVSATTLLVLVYLTSLLGFWSPVVNRLVRARPSVLVEQGTLVPRELDRERITVEEVEAAARREGLISLRDVRRATLEADGSISIVPWD